MFLTYASSSVGTAVAKGTYPETTRSATFDDGMIGNISFTAIPDNAANKAGALVVSDLLLSPETQLAKVGPDTPGLDPAIGLSKVPDDISSRAWRDRLGRARSSTTSSPTSWSRPRPRAASTTTGGGL